MAVVAKAERIKSEYEVPVSEKAKECKRARIVELFGKKTHPCLRPDHWEGGQIVPTIRKGNRKTIQIRKVGKSKKTIGSWLRIVFVILWLDWKRERERDLVRLMKTIEIDVRIRMWRKWWRQVILFCFFKSNGLRRLPWRLRLARPLSVSCLVGSDERGRTRKG